MARPAAWPDAWIEVLREGWPNLRVSAQDLADEINARFGASVTRNAVIGQVRRRGIVKPGVRRGARYKKAPRPIGKMLLLADRPPTACSFPIGDRPPYKFCGVPAETPGSPYCDAHRAVVYRRKS